MDYSRQHEVFDNNLAKSPVHIIGCGATGSWVALSLAKLGVPTIHLYDFDVVEEHNLPNQAFLEKHIGMPKVEALTSLCKELGSTSNIIPHNEKVEGGAVLSGYVFMLVDSMKARFDIFKKSVRFKSTIELMIETRMDAFVGMIYTVKPLNLVHVKGYEKTLYTDEEATISICGIAQSLAPTASILANQAVWQYMKHVMTVGDMPNEIMLDLKFNVYLTNNWE